MAYPKRELNIVHECDDDNGNPTCWSMAGGDPNTCEVHYIWICKYDDHDFRVEDSYGNNQAGKIYKTLWGAKRAAEEIIWRQDETGAYSD